MVVYDLLTEPQYFGSIAYFVRLIPAKTLQLEVCGSYQKQTYQNRCYILTSQQVDKLIVPIKHHTGNAYKEAKIAYHTPWPQRHWRALCTAYGKAPYFRSLTDMIHPILFDQHVYLLDLNVALLRACLAFLALPKRITFTTSYHKKPSVNTIDDRGLLHPKKNLPTTGFSLPTYQHVFDHPYIPNLSILDLLFCEGPYAQMMLQKAAQYPSKQKRLPC